MSTPRRPFNLRLLYAGLTAILASSVFFVQPTLATPPVTERVSVDSAGNEGDLVSQTPSISGDGQLIVFASEATNLVENDLNDAQDIFLHDWLTGATTRISVSATGQESNGDSAWPAISADSNVIAFSSNASNLVEGDSNQVEDVFVVDRSTGLIERVSLSSSREEANGASSQPVISSDGRYIAFVSSATNLFPGASSGHSEVYLYDRVKRAILWVSAPAGVGNNDDDSREVTISGDGNWVAFSSSSTQLVGGDTNNRSDIFLWSRGSNTIARLNLSSSGAQADRSSYEPAISSDGRWIAFRSYATNLVGNDTNGMGDIFLCDRLNGNIQLVSLSSTGEQAQGGSSDEAVVSADGRFVAFRSSANNLVASDTNGMMDIFVRDMQGTTTRVSVDSNGSQSNDNNYAPTINLDGAILAFYSVSTNLDLVLVDTNNTGDVFAHGEKPVEPTPTPTTEPTETPTEEPTPTETATVEPTITPTETATPEPTITPTDEPTATQEPTDTPEPTETPTVEPTSTPTALPTTVTPDPTDPPEPTEPPNVCSWVLDFETDALGNDLARGVIIDNEWAPFGIHITTNDPTKHPAMIFDSAKPTGYDVDLGTPNQDFGGPGRGYGGGEGQPGENRWPLGNILILTEDGDQSDPDDYYAGGTFIFTFDEPAKLHTVQLVDIDTNETTVRISAYDQAGNKLGVFKAQPYGNNSVQVIPIDLDGVSKLEVHLQSSGAIAAISFCNEKPTPVPTPKPTDEPMPTATNDPPTSSDAPVIELKSEVSAKEGSPFTLSGSFQDPDSAHWSATVNYGDGLGAQPLNLSTSKSFKLRWTYGDNGEYTAIVRVTDDSGAVGEAILTVNVKNLSPQIESDDLHSLEACDRAIKENGKDKGRSACRVGDWFVATVGQPTVFTLNLNDAGSDDLKIRWSFADEVIYYNNGESADPYPSPLGTYPFHITHSAPVVFEKPGVQYVSVDVYDDDGTKVSMKLKVLVRGKQNCRTSLGYWIHRFKKEGYSVYSGELRAHLSILSAFVTSSFGEFRPEMIDALESFILLDTSDKAQARAQLITAWLNFTNGAVDWDEIIDDADGRHDLPYAEVLREILAILVDRGASEDELRHAIELAESINLHSHRGRSCPVYIK
jgi:outer membrane biosynthesis protein TonB